MRISPKSLSPAEALAKAKAKSQVRDEARQETLRTEEAEAAANKTSPAAIDAGRAQRLLERASALAERGDMGAAVLATRQSLALAPDNVEAHLLHAGLLERQRDFGGARTAYEKSVQLAPQRADARANLARLDTYLEKSQGAASQFHFDADELFAPARNSALAPESMPRQDDDANAGAAEVEESATATQTLAEPAAPKIAAPSLEVDSMEMFDESMLPNLEVRLPPSRAEAAISDEATSLTGDKNNPQVPAQSAFMAQNDNAVAPAREQPSNAPEGDRRKHNTPVATERRHRPSADATKSLVAPIAAVPVAAVPVVAVAATPARTPVAAPLAPANVAGSPFDPVAPIPIRATRAPLDLDIPVAPGAPLWQQVVSRPSFYARTLPLVGVALLSLGFLSWARERAVSQVVAPVPTELASVDNPTVIEPPATVPGTTLPLPNTPAQSGEAALGSDAKGFPISNAPAVFQAPPASGAASPNASAPDNASGNTGSNSNARSNNNSAPSTTARASNRGPNSNSGNARPRRALPPTRPVPNFPGVSLAPAPIPPASVRSTIPRVGTNQNGGGNNIILPSPNIEMPAAPAPRQRVLPPTDNGLNPAGSPNRGYVRVTEGRVGNGVVPSQPSAVARENERAANDAARNGQNDQAISQLSQAIRADSDNAGFRYQQRATLFLQRGDYNRASDDFQSAISAYQAQIANGDDVAQARRGLSSARSGLTLALAGKRG